MYVLTLDDHLQPRAEPKRLTFQKRFINGPVWTPDGRELVFGSGSISDWSRVAVTKDGIYFIPVGRITAGLPSAIDLDFLDFATQKIEKVARLEKPPFIGMTVSADQHWLLFAQIDQVGADLMLIDKFR